MLIYNFGPIFKARQIEKPYTFLVKAGIAPHTASRIISNEMRIMRLDNIETLCEILHCEPNDFIIYTPEKDRQLPESHPLNKLLAKETNFDWQQSLRTMPLSKLNEIGKLIAAPDNDAQRSI